MVKRIQELHMEVHDNLKKQLSYKETIDKSRRKVKFEEECLVMIHLQKSKFLTTMKNRQLRLCKILAKYGTKICLSN